MKKRKSNIEALRILSMPMIVTLHFLGHGGILEQVPVHSGTYYFAWIIEALCFVSVNCYVLISGYFLIASTFTWKKLISLILEVFTYSFGIYLVLLMTGQISFQWLSFITAFIPILGKSYWFVTIYVAMYVLSPFINRALQSFNQKQHFALACLSVFLFSIWPNVFFFIDPLLSGGGTGIAWFLCLYIVSSYIRLYYKPVGKWKRYGLLFIGFSFLTALSRFGFSYLSDMHIIDPQYIGIFYNYNSIFILGASLFLFLGFLNIEIKQKWMEKVILWTAPLTFGVYLIHDHPSLRPLLWNWVDAFSKVGKWYFPVFMIFVILSIFLICIFTEYIRKKIFIKVLDPFLKSIDKSVQSFFNFNTLKRIVGYFHTS